MAVHDAARDLREGNTHTAHKTGKVTGVREDYEDKTLLHVDIELPLRKRTKKRRKGMVDAGDTPESFHPSTSTVVPISMGLKVGDKVTVTTSVKRG